MPATPAHTDTRALSLGTYQAEMEAELKSILSYWSRHAVDDQRGGFHGSIDHSDMVVPGAPRGIVMYSRICWAFSAAYGYLPDKAWLQMATRSFRYIRDNFVDQEYGGVYWSLTENGEILDSKKQVYGLAFCIYGLSEYYRVTGDRDALRLCHALTSMIEENSHDKVKGGYLEAFTREWKPLADLRLSDKDDNASKTMNTHLHVVEAYTNLYKADPSTDLKEKIASLLQLFDEKFLDHSSGHYRLFFDDNWQSQSELVSYGHDIEAAWLLQQCAEVIEHPELTGLFRKLAIQVTNAAAEAQDDDGGLWYESGPAGRDMILEKHSWPQAEAMIGFFNAYQLTGRHSYLEKSIGSWLFTRRFIRDNEKGEWFWGVLKDYAVMKKDKAGFWKCPYHNTRACLEIIHRINNL